MSRTGGAGQRTQQVAQLVSLDLSVRALPGFTEAGGRVCKQRACLRLDASFGPETLTIILSLQTDRKLRFPTVRLFPGKGGVSKAAVQQGPQLGVWGDVPAAGSLAPAAPGSPGCGLGKLIDYQEWA